MQFLLLLLGSLFHHDYDPELSDSVNGEFAEQANLPARPAVASAAVDTTPTSPPLEISIDYGDEMDLETVLDVAEDAVDKMQDEPVDNIPMFDMEDVEEETVDDLPMFYMETSTIETSPSTPTTETPPGTPPTFACPIANTEGEIAKKGGPFWCTHIGCTRTENGGGAPFTQKVNMESHVKSVHEKIKFMCSICNKNISSKGNLSAHMTKTHAPPGKHGALKQCPICNKKMRGDLARHCRNVHGSS